MASSRGLAASNRSTSLMISTMPAILGAARAEWQARGLVGHMEQRVRGPSRPRPPGVVV
ncbi:hypothetical protein GCM10017674_73150 [Streptomyces gardneri]|nr:hypothetical protein GCM10017674_73150 [Streptomyces gardneri]